MRMRSTILGLELNGVGSIHGGTSMEEETGTAASGRHTQTRGNYREETEVLGNQACSHTPQKRKQPIGKNMANPKAKSPLAFA